MTDARSPNEFCEGWATHLGVGTDILIRPGTTIFEREDRSGTGYAACYSLGQHCVVMTDPGLAGELDELRSDSETATAAELRAFKERRGWTFENRGVQKTLAGPFAPDQRLLTNPALSGYRTAQLDWTNDEHLDAIASFIDASNEADLEQAEIELDNLDERCIAILHPDGQIAAYASVRPWIFGHYGDIGVMTRSKERGRGLGRAVVAALIADVMPAEWQPLYRHERSNAGSDRLSTSLGFVVATSLVAVGPTEPL